ncbi:putative nuclease HARBI1 [Nymphalis io]|uniref:putative nuclease HARBI1 n=1 Tax=Inachis io TaxID=171585 RepID=UPI00216A61DC|nr:putative nuclease HARBI1 [Nymphalis io]
MSRAWLLLNLLKEAHELDVNTSRREAQLIRYLPIRSRSDEIIRIYRLNEELIAELQNELRALLSSNKRKGLTKRSKLLCTLSFLASGSYQKILGTNINTFLSQSSVSRSINEVVEALNHPSIIKKYLRFPQNISERQELKERFYKKFRIPDVIGCIDGTFVAIIRPQDNDERYYCRKGFYARNVMLIVDADMNILHADVSYGGSTHDSFVFNNSIIKTHLLNLTNSGEVVYLLGNSGYPQLQYVMTPVSDTNADKTPEGYYNQLHAAARSTVERAIADLKARFQCLLVNRVLHYHPDSAAKIIIACCILHNICNHAGLPAPTLSEDDLHKESSLNQSLPNRSYQSDSELALGYNFRQQLIDHLWHSRNNDLA